MASVAMECVLVNTENGYAILESRQIFPGSTDVGSPTAVVFGFPYSAQMKKGEYYRVWVTHEPNPADISRKFHTTL